MSVTALAEALGTSQQNLSKHLGVLVDARMVARRKDGTHVFYRIADEGLFAHCEQACGSLQAQLGSLSELVGASPRRSRP